MSMPKAKTNNSNIKGKKQLQKKVTKKSGLKVKNQQYSQKSQSKVRKQWAEKQTQDVVPIPPAKSLVNQLKLEVPFEVAALNLGIAGFVSFLLSKGLQNNTINQGLPAPWRAVYSGATYMMSGIIDEIGGSVTTLSRRPIIMDEFIAALSATEVNTMKYGRISYSWADLVAPSAIQTIPNGDGIWDTTYIAGDNELYNNPAVIFNSTISKPDYSDLLKILGGLGNTPRLRLVDAGKSPLYSTLLHDPSAFSRVYRYNGLNPTATSGYYKNLENEGRITNTIYANFCAYTTPDKRVPINFAKSSGDACLGTAWGLHSTYTDPRNMSPVQYKLIDFEELFFTIAVWAAKAKEKLQVSVINNDPNYTPPFIFSMQDLRIVFRQALLNVFDTQYFTQFTGPVQHFGTPQDNAFIPFMVMGNTYGATHFDQFMLPDLLKETLNALRARNIRIPGKSNRNTPTVVPVLGRWYLDTPAVFQYSFGGVTTDLFATLPQDPIILTDGRIAQTEYVDLNGAYYKGVMANWNDFVGACSGISTPFSAILSDGGPTGLGTLHYTRVEQAAPDEFSKGPSPTSPMYVKTMRYLKNSGIVPPKKDESPPLRAPMTKNDSKKNVQAIPPASVVRLANTISTTSIPMSSTHEEFFNLVWTPSIRLNITEEDALTCQMYQTEIREVLSLFHERFPPNTGAGMASKLTQLANLCFTGAGHDNSNTYAMIMQHLQDRAQAGFLAQLLGGFVKQIVPGVDGIVDTIASLVPI